MAKKGGGVAGGGRGWRKVWLERVWLEMVWLERVWLEGYGWRVVLGRYRVIQFRIADVLIVGGRTPCFAEV